MDEKKSPENLGCQNETKKIGFNSLSNQRNRMLTEFKTGKQLSTFFIRDILGIPHPAGRIKELRIKHEILTLWTRESDRNGITHRIALYVYMGSKPRMGGH
ncbi:hypothetical protein Lrub_0724 [Legionella rubrilucens]|uniref:Winged helix-turn-helix domain-containing protein n=1 Tax=Legionella rubrilucens TaxID=458 RepID=A0A0W0XUS2_9GAMM|nr:helix-turn-helix domain-containing protein [Legionella rubrilucens]KTD48373.1 hypothetical protein Lrub_0724 [Legionella rubrilucens]